MKICSTYFFDYLSVRENSNKNTFLYSVNIGNMKCFINCYIPYSLMSSQYVLVNVSLFTEEKVYREYTYVRL